MNTLIWLARQKARSCLMVEPLFWFWLCFQLRSSTWWWRAFEHVWQPCFGVWSYWFSSSLWVAWPQEDMSSVRPWCGNSFQGALLFAQGVADGIQAIGLSMPPEQQDLEPWVLRFSNWFPLGDWKVSVLTWSVLENLCCSLTLNFMLSHWSGPCDKCRRNTFAQ